MGWIKSKFQGVRYREHPTRKHGLLPDRYYTIFYKLDGKMVQEALGWASESWEEQINGERKRANWTEKRAAGVLAELQKNQSVGTGPRTLKEKRAMQEKTQAILKAESLTLAEFWEQDYQHVLKARIKPASWKKEVSHFQNRINPLMGNKALTSITSVDIERMVDQMRADKLTPRTQQYAVGTFFRIWKLAAKRKLVKIGDNPATAIPVKQVNNARLRILSPEELKSILQHLAASDSLTHDITLFCAYTGCRFSEAARLKWEHVDLARNAALLTETKNKDSREIYLEPEIISLLERRIPGRTGEFVFTKKDGSLLIEPPKSFKAAVDKLGFNKDRGPRDRITFHSLRHTAATFAARNHIDVKDMQLIFGWKTPSMVFRYVKGNESARRHAMKGLARTLSGEESKIVPIEKAEEVSGR